MTRRLPVTPAPGPLEEYAAGFDALFAQRAQRHAFRRYLEGLLLPAERNKTLTALANTEPVVGAQEPRAQGLQWFLSESTWEPDALNARRLELLRTDPLTAPHAAGVLVIDEHGDRKWGTTTAHVGRQYLANLGKIDTGVVSVTSLWADERVYWPVHVAPYTPAHHFTQGTADPGFRTKLQLALDLVGRAVDAGLPFRAVVADRFYGEDRAFRRGLQHRQLGYVLALKPSHAWWHPEGAIGSLQEVAQAATWGGPDRPDAWVRVERAFRDGHTETWWALEVVAGPYGPAQAERAVIVTTDPERLPALTTWYLVTNLPAPGSARARAAQALPAADVAEVVRLYGLRMWVEQSYKQTKHALGWSQYQVRSDLAIRRHWQLVCCAFSFCWHAQRPVVDEEDDPPAMTDTPPASTTESGRGKNQRRPQAAGVVARGTARGAGMAGAVGHALALLARVVQSAPATPAPSAA